MFLPLLPLLTTSKTILVGSEKSLSMNRSLTGSLRERDVVCVQSLREKERECVCVRERELDLVRRRVL